jgi:hypothetical protein
MHSAYQDGWTNNAEDYWLELVNLSMGKRRVSAV